MFHNDLIVSQAKRKRRGSLLLAFACSIALLAAPSFAATLGYAYDDLGRLKSVTYPNGMVVEYTYDTADNRTKVQASIGGTGGGTGSAPVCTNWAITVTGVPLPPQGPNTVSVTPGTSNFIAHCSDADGNTMTLVTPTATSFSINRGQTFSVPYSVSDGQGNTGSATLTISFP